MQWRSKEWSRDGRNICIQRDEWGHYESAWEMGPRRRECSRQRRCYPDECPELSRDELERELDELCRD